MDESISLDPKVKISDLDISSLPLRNFHIIDDAIGDIDPSVITVPIAKDVEETFIIIAGEGLGVSYHFEPVVNYSDFIVNNNNFEFERLSLLLDGIAKNYPERNRVGIVGGMYGDEIVRAANAVQAAGFDTTIVTRYCVSEKVFLNLDEMIDAANAERMKYFGEAWEIDTGNDFDDE